MMMTAPIKIVYHPASAASRAVLLFLKSNNIPHEAHISDKVLLEGATEVPGNFEHINFSVLQTGDIVPHVQLVNSQIYECGAILEYITQKYNSMMAWHWMPPSAEEAAKVRQWMEWHYSNLHKGIMGFLNYRAWIPLKTGNTAQFDSKRVEEYEKVINNCLKILDNHLSKSRFTAGTHVSISDLYPAFELEYLDALNFSFSSFSHVISWRQELTKLPHYGEVNQYYEHKILPALKEKFSKKD